MLLTLLSHISNIFMYSANMTLYPYVSVCLRLHYYLRIDYGNRRLPVLMYNIVCIKSDIIKVLTYLMLTLYLSQWSENSVNKYVRENVCIDCMIIWTLCSLLVLAYFPICLCLARVTADTWRSLWPALRRVYSCTQCHFFICIFE